MKAQLFSREVTSGTIEYLSFNPDFTYSQEALTHGYLEPGSLRTGTYRRRGERILLHDQTVAGVGVVAQLLWACIDTLLPSPQLLHVRIGDNIFLLPPEEERVFRAQASAGCLLSLGEVGEISNVWVLVR